MTIIVFLIDTSASMYQRTYVGGRTTLLDVAKSAVETFVKIRQRSPDSRIDRYMLLTFEEPPNNIKAGWKENLTTFMNELKNLQCNSMTTMGVAVKQAFDILNINRMTTGIDTYGQGRCPFFLETAVIVLITDGGKLSTVNGVHEEFMLPMIAPIPGSEMTREPFRWDQRLFALVLRLAGTPATDRDGLVPSDSSPIDPMCEVTGGRSYSIVSHRMLNQCIDSLVQKVQNGVVINFEKFGPDPPLSEKGDEMLMPKDDMNSNAVRDMDYSSEPSNLDKLQMTSINQPANTSWYNCRKMIYVPRSTQKLFVVGFWPIPEPFWPEVTASVLPARSAHPNVKFSCTSSNPMAIENLPFDKYELEPSPLTQFILARKQPTVCWQVFVANSYKNSDVGHPFGYLKASTNLTCVNLFVMPYNYPVLLPLLDELTKVHRWKPGADWRAQFQNYLRTLPAYYAAPLRRALMKMGTPQLLANTLIPENAENSPSYSVMNYLKRLKNLAKVEYDKMCGDIIQRQLTVKNHFNIPEQLRVLPRVSLKRDLISNPLLADKFNYLREQIVELNAPYISTVEKDRQTVSYRNPFDIPRNRLMAHVAKMRNNFLQSDWLSIDEDSTHALPISQMGNYQEYLKRQTPQLREIESTPVRQHMFGNPFKIDKRMMVDEADIDLVGASCTGGTGRPPKRTNPNPITDIASRLPTKRKPGPLPRDLVVRRPSTASSITCTSDTASLLSSPPASPAPSMMSTSSSPSSVLSLSPPASPVAAVAVLTPVVATAAATVVVTSSPVPSPVPWLNFHNDKLDEYLPSPQSYPPTNHNSLTPTAPLVNGYLDTPLPPPIPSLPPPSYSRSPPSPPLSPSLAQPPPITIITHTTPTTTTDRLDPPLYSVPAAAAVGRQHGNTGTGTGSPLSGYAMAHTVGTASSGYSVSAAESAALLLARGSGGNNGVGLVGYGGMWSGGRQHVEMRQASVTTTATVVAAAATSQVLKEVNCVNSGGVVVIGPVVNGTSGGGDVKPVKIENVQEIESQNLEVRKTLNKLVRRPGKNFTELFESIKTLKGDLQVQVSIVKLVINESLRFKRKHLALLLEEYIQNMMSMENK